MLREQIYIIKTHLREQLIAHVTHAYTHVHIYTYICTHAHVRICMLQFLRVLFQSSFGCLVIKGKMRNIYKGRVCFSDYAGRR